MLAAFTEAVTIVRRTKGAPDDFGNDTWTEVGTVVRAVMAPGVSSEQIQGRNSITIQPSIYVPAGTDVTRIDAVFLHGLKYEVDGEPVTWVHPLTGWAPGIEVKLRRAEG